jgi:chaperonin GroES
MQQARQACLACFLLLNEFVDKGKGGFSTMELQPLGDRIVVKQDEAEEQTASGLYLSSGSTNRPARGEVIAVGPGKVNDDGVQISSPVKVGDTVVFGKYGGTAVTVDGVEYQILRFDDVYAVID